MDYPHTVSGVGAASLVTVKGTCTANAVQLDREGTEYTRALKNYTTAILIFFVLFCCLILFYSLIFLIEQVWFKGTSTTDTVHFYHNPCHQKLP